MASSVAAHTPIRPRLRRPLEITSTTQVFTLSRRTAHELVKRINADRQAHGEALVGPGDGFDVNVHVNINGKTLPSGCCWISKENPRFTRSYKLHDKEMQKRVVGMQRTSMKCDGCDLMLRLDPIGWAPLASSNASENEYATDAMGTSDDEDNNTEDGSGTTTPQSNGTAPLAKMDTGTLSRHKRGSDSSVMADGSAKSPRQDAAPSPKERTELALAHFKALQSKMDKRTAKTQTLQASLAEARKLLEEAKVVQKADQADKLLVAKGALAKAEGVAA